LKAVSRIDRFANANILEDSVLKAGRFLLTNHKHTHMTRRDCNFFCERNT